MATIISGYTHRDEMASAIKTALTSVFDFKSVDGYDLYITDDIYLTLGTNGDMTIHKGALACTIPYNNYGYYDWKVIKSESGDVAFRVGTAENTYLADGQGLGMIITKVKDALTDESGWGVFVPQSALVQSVRYLITDDVAQLIDNSGRYSQGTTDAAAKYAVWNGNAKISHLIPAAAVCSQCVSENLRVIDFGPREYFDDCTIKGKAYYSLGQVVMLDESEN